jgi:anti-anti-sigma regulatory factor
MKLKLAVENDVAVLEVFEEVEAKDVAILRAGMTRLIEGGRNRVIIDLSHVRVLDAATLAEILALDSAAATLKGQLTVSGQSELVRQALKLRRESGALPRHFATKAAALASLREHSKSVSRGAAPKEDVNKALRDRLAKLTAENLALKDKAAQLAGLGTIRDLRRDNGRLTSELSALQELHRESPKTPFSSAELDRKIETLARAYTTILTKVGLLG